MKQRQATKKDLQRDLESIKEDLATEKVRMGQITAASQRLALAIQALAKPGARREQQR